MNIDMIEGMVDEDAVVGATAVVERERTLSL